jgi:hypothetical protein
MPQRPFWFPERIGIHTSLVFWLASIIKFFYFFSVGCPLHYHVYLGTLALSTSSIDVLEPGFSSSCVIDPWCFLCDLFIPLFSQQDRHLGIWHCVTSLVALMLQFFVSSSVVGIAVAIGTRCGFHA